MAPKTAVAKIKALLAKDLPEKKHAEFVKLMSELKDTVVGGEEGKPDDEVVNHVVNEILEEDLLFEFVKGLATFPFEARKLVVLVVNKCVQLEVNDAQPGVAYIQTKHPEVLSLLCQGYEDLENALNYGQILRVCIKQEPLARIILSSEELFYPFFDHVNKTQFDIASDAFSTLKALLTSHKYICAEFLEKNYDKVFSHYQKLLESDNYVTKRQSLKLLGEMLLDRANFTVMTKYIADANNLKLMMMLLKNKSRNIQFEAFHVFKVFVANPNKEAEIKKILIKNKDKLDMFLKEFHSDRAEDEQFKDEKAYLIQQIKDLKM